MLSRFSDLMSEEKKAHFKKWGRVIEAGLLASALYIAGSLSGYWVRNSEARDDAVRVEQAHNAEIARLTDAYKISLQALTPQVKEAAQAAEQAAAAVKETATTVDNAASTAQNAAKTAQSAAKQSATAARSVAEPSREAINREVRRANSAIKP